MIQCSRKGTNEFLFFGSNRGPEPSAMAQGPALAALALHSSRCYGMGFRCQRNRTGNISRHLRFNVFQAEGDTGKKLVFQSFLKVRNYS